MSRNQRRNRRNKSGARQTANRNADCGHVEDRSAVSTHHRSSTETKSSLKTTELLAYAAAVLAVIMTALAIDADGEGGNDPFGAESAIRYITYLTIGYMIARGLAKSGSHNVRVEHDADHTVGHDDVRTVLAHDEGTRDEIDDAVARDVVAGHAGTGDVEIVDADGPATDPVRQAGTGSTSARP